MSKETMEAETISIERHYEAIKRITEAANEESESLRAELERYQDEYARVEKSNIILADELERLRTERQDWYNGAALNDLHIEQGEKIESLESEIQSLKTELGKVERINNAILSCPVCGEERKVISARQIKLESELESTKRKLQAADEIIQHNMGNSLDEFIKWRDEGAKLDREMEDGAE